MKTKLNTRKPNQPRESGAAMLIAIFALMLISIVAIALVVSSGTDTSLAGNYRTATSAYYAGVAGLEEARGRLLWKNPDCLVNRPISPPNCPNVGFIPMDPITGILPALGLTDVRYILNPASGETVDPTNLSPLNPYADNEYSAEFGWAVNTTNWQTTASVSSVSGLPGPTYKWVRINVVTEKALGVDVNGDGAYDPTTPLVYDPAPAFTTPCPSANPLPGLFVPNCLGWSSNTAVQALEITALAVAPNGGHRLLQYIVAPLVISPDTMDQNFPAALTLDDGLAGNAVTFTPPTGFQISGVDFCKPPVPPSYSGSLPAIGYSSSADSTYILDRANLNPSDYPGIPINSTPPPFKSTSPSLVNLGLPPPNTLLRQTWLSPATLDSAMQDIEKSADVVLTGPATGSDIWNAAPAMSATNPMTIVVNGDLTLSGSFGPADTGYGLLLVTGTLTYHPSAAWYGLVLVVGKGQFSLAGHHGTGGIYGAVLVAQTRDASGNLLPSLQATFGPSTGSATGTGITYDSCWVRTAQGPLTYKVLSFHEIPLPN